MSKLRNNQVDNTLTQDGNFSLYDHYPEYLQIQRTPGAISGYKVSFQTYTPDPNLFLSSESYIKIL